MRKFFEAFVYFVENGIDPKTAKEFAEKVTGIKAPEGEIKIPKTKGPDEFKTPEAKQDVMDKVASYVQAIRRIREKYKQDG